MAPAPDLVHFDEPARDLADVHGTRDSGGLPARHFLGVGESQRHDEPDDAVVHTQEGSAIAGSVRFWFRHRGAHQKLDRTQDLQVVR